MKDRFLCCLQKNPKKFKFGAKKNSGTQERYMKKIGEKKITTIAQKLSKKAVSSNYTSPFSVLYIRVLIRDMFLAIAQSSFHRSGHVMYENLLN